MNSQYDRWVIQLANQEYKGNLQQTIATATFGFDLVN